MNLKQDLLHFKFKPMKKSRTIICKVIFIAFMISVSSQSLFGQNKTIDTIEIYFSHNGNQLHGWFYKASGIGTFPTVILLHGAGGQDGDIFNLGESLSEEGFNVMTYNYPGSWRSEGLKTDRAALGSI